jgi:iron complex outermembrane receptor protein
MRHILKSFPFTAALLAGCAAAATSIAATKDAGDGAPAPDEVIVTGRHATADALHIGAPTTDLPIAVQIVPIQAIQDQGFVRLGDAVRDVSGVTRKEAYFGLTDSFNIRGFDGSTGLFNGFRHDYYLQVVDLAHVQSVEVIKGPASVTTGFLEPGGVVNTITKRPTADPISDINLQAGSYGFAQVQGDFSRKLSDQLAVRLTGAVQTTDSFRDYVGSKHYTAGTAIDWTPTSKTKVELSAYYTYIDAVPDRGLPNAPISLTISPDRFFGQPSDSYHLHEYEASAVVTQEITSALSLRAGFDWSRSQDIRRNTQAISLQPDGRTYSRDYTVVPGSEDTKTAFIEGNLRFNTFGLSNRLTAGVDYTRQDQKYQFLDTDVTGAFVAPIDIYTPNYNVPPPGAVGPDGHASGGPTDVGFYLNDLINFGPFDLLLGVRQDRFTYYDSDVDYPPPLHFADNATTPRVGLVYKIPQLSRFGVVSLYANYAESFNPQLYITLANHQNPTPSKGKQTEVGVKYETSDGRYSASFAAFRIDKTNVATPDPSDPTGTYSILSGEDRSQGLELDIVAKPIEGLRALLAMSNMRADVRRDEVLPIGDRLVNVPETQATFTARYDIPHTSFGLGGSVYYVGAREATLPNTFTVPSYTRVDAAVFWKLTPRVELAVNLQNIGDVRYYDSQDNSLFPGAPRSVLGTVRLSF